MTSHGELNRTSKLSFVYGSWKSTKMADNHFRKSCLFCEYF